VASRAILSVSGESRIAILVAGAFIISRGAGLFMLMLCRTITDGIHTGHARNRDLLRE
jgi:hypothetical protein